MFTKSQTGQLQEPEGRSKFIIMQQINSFLIIKRLLKSLLLIIADLGFLKLFSVETIEYSQFHHGRFFLMRASLIS